MSNLSELQQSLSDSIRQLGVLTANFNTLDAKKIALWLDKWIRQSQNPESRLKLVQQNFAQNRFWAKLGLKDQTVSDISSQFNSLNATVDNRFMTIYENRQQMFIGESEADLHAFSKALQNAVGTSRAPANPLSKGQMLVEASRIYNEAKKEIENGSSSELYNVLCKKLSTQSHLFSQEFLIQMASEIGQTRENTNNIYNPLISSNKSTALLDFLNNNPDFTDCTDAELNSIANENPNSYAESVNFISQYTRRDLSEFESSEIKSAIKEDYAKLSKNAKALLTLRSREAQCISELGKYKANSVVNLFSQINIGKTVIGGIIGYLAGGLFGQSTMGMLITALFGLGSNIVSSEEDNVIKTPQQLDRNPSNATKKTTVTP